jgi:Mor family transcriptional regulator
MEALTVNRGLAGLPIPRNSEQSERNREIRRRCREGESHQSISQAFGLSEWRIRTINEKEERRERMGYYKRRKSCP